jgi:hypothetical protein
MRVRSLFLMFVVGVFRVPGASAQDAPGELPVPPPPPASRIEASSSRLPKPSLEEQRKAEEEVRELFKDEYAKKAPEDRKALARKLLESARGTKSDPASLYVLLREAAEIAASMGDVKTTMAAADETVARFELDAAKLRADALERARRAVRTPEALRDLIGAYLAAVDASAGAEDYDGALMLLKKAETAARAARDAALLARIREQDGELCDLQKELRRVQPSLAKLEADPGDPAANLAVGRFRCFVKNDWEAGLPMLAKGSDADLKALAERELAAPSEAAGKAALGDGWWDAASGKGKADKARYRGRAAHWYEMALPRLDGIEKIKIDKKVKDAYAAYGHPGSVSLARAQELLRRLDSLTEPEWSRLAAFAEVTVHADFRKNGDSEIALDAGSRYLLLPCPADRWNTSPSRWEDVDYRGHRETAERATNGMYYLLLSYSLNGARLVSAVDEPIVQGPGTLRLEPSDREGGGGVGNNRGFVRVKVLKIGLRK